MPKSRRRCRRPRLPRVRIRPVRFVAVARCAFGEAVEQSSRRVRSVGEERAVEQRGLTTGPASGRTTGAVRAESMDPEDVVEQQRDHVHGDAVVRVLDLVGDGGPDVGHQVSGTTVSASPSTWQRGGQRRRQVELLPVGQRVEHRRRRAERHQRIEVGKSPFDAPPARVVLGEAEPSTGAPPSRSRRARPISVVAGEFAAISASACNPCRIAGEARAREISMPSPSRAIAGAFPETERSRVARLGQVRRHVDVRRTAGASLSIRSNVAIRSRSSSGRRSLRAAAPP